MTKTSPNEISRPKPVIEDWSKEFFASGGEGRLRLQQCNHCGKTIYFPKIMCPECGSRDYTWVEQPLEATLYSFSTIRVPENPYFQDAIPFMICLAELENGVRIFGRLECGGGTNPEIKDRITMRFEKVEDGVWLPYFAHESVDAA